MADRNLLRDPRDARQRYSQVSDPVQPLPADVRIRRQLSPPVALPGGYSAGTKGGTLPDPATLPPWLFPPRVHFPIDAPQNRIPAVIAAGGSLVISFPEIPQGTTATIRKIGVSTSDALNTRITTQLNRNAVPPYGGIFGAVGSIENPTELAGADRKSVV